MNGGRLVMTKGETELEMIPYVEGGELLMLWQLHREGLGKAVEITTGELSAEAVPSYALSAPSQQPQPAMYYCQPSGSIRLMATLA